MTKQQAMKSGRVNAGEITGEKVQQRRDKITAGPSYGRWGRNYGNKSPGGRGESTDGDKGGKLRSTSWNTRKLDQLSIPAIVLVTRKFPASSNGRVTRTQPLYSHVNRLKIQAPTLCCRECISLCFLTARFANIFDGNGEFFFTSKVLAT